MYDHELNNVFATKKFCKFLKDNTSKELKLNKFFNKPFEFLKPIRIQHNAFSVSSRILWGKCKQRSLQIFAFSRILLVL